MVHRYSFVMRQNTRQSHANHAPFRNIETKTAQKSPPHRISGLNWGRNL
jgi:hypothetical protein